MPLIATLRTHA